MNDNYLSLDDEGSLDIGRTVVVKRGQSWLTKARENLTRMTDYPTQQQQSEVQEESWDKDDYPTQQQQQQSQPQTEVEDDSWDMDDYPTYVSHNHYRNSF
jgi:hypothetical protein